MNVKLSCGHFEPQFVYKYAAGLRLYGLRIFNEGAYLTFKSIFH